MSDDAATCDADDTRIAAAAAGSGAKIMQRYPLNAAALDRLFREARSHNGWRPDPVGDDTLRALWDLVKWGPTSANCMPARLLFLRTPEAKKRLEPHLSPGNVTKTMTAPVVAVIGYDLAFYERLPRLFPHNKAAMDWFVGADKQRATELTAFRNGTLQGGYFLLAARALGLDCGPLSGFDQQAVDAAFWAGTSVRTNFICNLGVGDPSALFERHPRLEFDEACRLL